MPVGLCACASRPRRLASLVGFGFRVQRLGEGSRAPCIELAAMSFHVSTVVFASSLRAWPISLSNGVALRGAESHHPMVSRPSTLSRPCPTCPRHFLLASINGLPLTSRSSLPASVRVRFVALVGLGGEPFRTPLDGQAGAFGPDRMSLPFRCDGGRRSESTAIATPCRRRRPCFSLCRCMRPVGSWTLARAHRRFLLTAVEWEPARARMMSSTMAAPAMIRPHLTQVMAFRVAGGRVGVGPSPAPLRKGWSFQFRVPVRSREISAGLPSRRFRSRAVRS